MNIDVNNIFGFLYALVLYCTDIKLCFIDQEAMGFFATYISPEMKVWQRPNHRCQTACQRGVILFDSKGLQSY